MPQFIPTTQLQRLPLACSWMTKEIPQITTRPINLWNRNWLASPLDRGSSKPFTPRLLYTGKNQLKLSFWFPKHSSYFQTHSVDENFHTSTLRILIDSDEADHRVWWIILRFSDQHLHQAARLWMKQDQRAKTMDFTSTNTQTLASTKGVFPAHTQLHFPAANSHDKLCTEATRGTAVSRGEAEVARCSKCSGNKCQKSEQLNRKRQNKKCCWYR